VHHASLAVSASELSGQVHETVDLTLQIPIRRISSVFPLVSLSDGKDRVKRACQIAFPVGKTNIHTHSQENTQPCGALLGMGGMGLRSRGSWMVSFNHVPLPRQAVNLQVDE
jgi:hypothetical protein